ncbi:MAG: glycosyltransferase [Thiothrix sp.]|nr:glycosyltransferase [Thiothrix sp.]HPQ94876.1 glycosyltransferase [Thiolinea sp.]
MDGTAVTVSVIVPAYNHAAWVGQAIHSVFRQTLTDWELILIDDASSDETWSVIQAYTRPLSSTNGRIITIRHTRNQGAPTTLNEGMALARGEYIAILNSDDAWQPERLERMVRFARRQELDFLVTGLNLWDRDAACKDESEPDWLKWYRGLYADWLSHGDFLRTLLRGNFFITTSNFFFQRHLFDTHGGFADLRYVHDYEYALRLFGKGAKMQCLWDEKLLNYRLHDHNTIREKPLAAIEENMLMLLEQLPELYPYLDYSRLEGLKFQLQDLQRYTREEWLSTIHYQLLNKEKELFALIYDRDEWIRDRDDIIASQQAMVTERDDWVAERDRTISTLQAVIRQQEQCLEAHKRMVSDRDSWIADRDGWITERDQMLKARDEHIRTLEQNLQALCHSRAYRAGTLLAWPVRQLRERLHPERWKLNHA